ncbi:MAG: phosphate ABC transporter ATP-binding protein [Candidatus Nanopelagicales bacterium]
MLPAASAFEIRELSVSYSGVPALSDISLDIPERGVSAIIGPSGSGKSTLLRTLNRMNDLVEGVRIEGRVAFRGRDLYGPDVDPTQIRRQIGMVFQKPNVFPRSIYDNVAYGPRLHHQPGNLDEIVREALVRSGLWEEVKHDLKQHAMTLSGGQQQRLVIARCIAVAPAAILMDEPTSSLDPLATVRVEELISELAADYTIVLVTHNLRQASRIADWTAFLAAERSASGVLHGRLAEVGPTSQLFTAPVDQRTKRFIAESMD